MRDESTQTAPEQLLQQVATVRIDTIKGMISQAGPANSDKEQALNAVLESQAFARSEQLKSFLRYVCELEIAGRSAEIKEYSIGTVALGRSDSYSPANDSSVRRRAFELRAKLEELYQSELANWPVRIEIPKGSYIPIFRFHHTSPVQNDPPRIVSENPVPANLAPFAVLPSRGISKSWIVAALGFGFLLGALAMRLLVWPAGSPAIIREAWGPLAAPQANVLICIAGNVQMTVRAGAFSPDADVPSFPAPAEIYPLYEKNSPWQDGAKLFMRPSFNNVPIGVVSAVAAAASSLNLLGTQYQILPERIAPMASFRNRNVILIGDPLNSFAAAKLFDRARLTIAHDPKSNRLVIRDRRMTASGPPLFSRVEGLPGKTAEVYGLLTVLPTDAGPSLQRRTLIVSGISNAGVHGAMEFFTSAQHLLDFKNRLRGIGVQEFPKAYQLVVRCTAENSLPLSCGYAAHYILD